MSTRDRLTSIVEPRAGVAVVECHGDHDLTSKVETNRLLLRLLDDHDLLVVDVSDAEFVDSSFLHLLVKADRRAKQQGKRVRIQLGSAPIVERALETSGILGYLDHARTREDAIA